MKAWVIIRKQLKTILAALKISEELGDKANMGSAYNNIGEIYNDQGNYEEALKNYLAGFELFQEPKRKTDDRYLMIILEKFIKSKAGMRKQ